MQLNNKKRKKRSAIFLKKNYHILPPNKISSNLSLSLLKSVEHPGAWLSAVHHWTVSQARFFLPLALTTPFSYR